MLSIPEVEQVAQRFDAMAPLLNERTRRRFAAAEALAIGHGGIAAVSRATGVSRRAIAVGIAEMEDPNPLPPECIRRPGGGRTPLILKDKTLLEDLDRLVEPTARGDPESPLRWTCMGVRKVAAELQQMGHSISHQKAAELLHVLHYSLQGNRKTQEGGSHPDRNAQFEYINKQVDAFVAGRIPVISIDAKKRELVGSFKNNGREWRPKGEPEQVQVYDFVDPELGRATPYGIYDIARNTGWVSVGIDHNTAAFAVESIRRWWHQEGSRLYEEATKLLITADCGGSNSYRVRLWKTGLQRLADETRLEITVCHLPPGTSKWNKIEHRLFSYISQNWRGRPLITYEVIVSLIGATTTSTGLAVHCQLDESQYPTGVKVSDEEMAALAITKHDFHGDWNYTISPRTGPVETVIP